MRVKRPIVATIEEVEITRQGATAIIRYRDPAYATVHLGIGDEIGEMTDEDILDVHNDVVRASEKLAAEYKHVAVEIPEGRPQLGYSPECDQWVPRGDVVRCIVADGGENGEATVWIDDREFSLREFGRMLTVHAGWGMRIVFVPDTEIAKKPKIEVRDVKDSDQPVGCDMD